MIGELYFISAIVAQLGLHFVVVGVVLRLCEGSWRKTRGELGSTRLLVGGGLMVLPFVCGLAWGLITR